MIAFEHWQTPNGLQVLFSQDQNTPLVAVNLMYNVGAKDENPEKTGLAHLFEHLMFSGSKNAPNYDQLLQKAGGENNAFTSNDVTNYYAIVPKENLELALFLEADRMRHMNLDQNALDVQKKVVIEEFKQRYLNQPYGDVWLKLRSMCYQKHPYQWPTIGKSIEQIEGFTLEDAKDFYARFYSPNNAVLAIVGNTNKKEVEALVEEYFGGFSPSKIDRPVRPQETIQIEKRSQTTTQEVPSDALYIAYLVGGRGTTSFHIADLLSDILTGGNSGRLYHELVKKQQLFSEINAYVSGEFDSSMFVISGKMTDGTSFDQAEQAIEKVLTALIEKGLEKQELSKVINKKITAEVYTDMQILNKGIKLAYALVGNQLDQINTYIDILQKISEEEVIHFVKDIIGSQKRNTLYYQAAATTQH